MLYIMDNFLVLIVALEETICNIEIVIDDDKDIYERYDTSVGDSKNKH